MSDNVFAGTMTLDNSRFIAAMDRAHNATTAALGPLKTMALGLTGLGGAFAALRSAEGIIGGIMGAFTKGRDLEILHRETGQSISDLVILQKAFVSVKIPAESVGTALFFLNKALGGVNEMGEPTDKAFARIGLSIADLKKMNAVDQFHAIIAGMAKLPDQASRSSVAMGIFSRSARDLQALLNDPAGFDAAVKAAGPMAEVMARNAAAFEKVDKTIQAIQANMAGLWAGVAEGLAPALQTCLDVLNKINLLDIGERLGRGIAVIIQAFKDGKIGELIGLSLTLAFKNAVNFMYGAIFGLAGAIGAALDTLPERMKAAFKMLTDKQFWVGIAEVAVGAFLSYEAKLSQMWLRIGILVKSVLQFAVDGMLTKMRGALDIVADFVPGLKVALAVLDRSGYKPTDKSLPDREAENSQEARGFNAKLGMLGSEGDALVKTGLEDVLQASRPVFVAISHSVQAMQDAFMEGMKKNKAFDTTADGKSLLDLIALLQSRIPKAAPGDVPTPSAGAAAPGIPSLSYKMPEGDRLSKLGLFVGASPSAPGLSEARRTANATETLVKKWELLGQVIRGQNQLFPRYL